MHKEMSIFFYQTLKYHTHEQKSIEMSLQVPTDGTGIFFSSPVPNNVN
jgi:hypothetical protein